MQHGEKVIRMSSDSRRRGRWASALALALISTVVMAAPMLAKSGGNSAAAAACRSGGYVNFTDTAGHPFRNAGACVSYAARGGTLVPVASGPFSVVYSSHSPGVFTATLSGTGLEPSSSVTFVFVWPARGVSITFNSQPNGTVSLVHSEQCVDENGANTTSLTATGTPAGGVPTQYSLPVPPASICP
jgi:hypothetical protein